MTEPHPPFHAAFRTGGRVLAVLLLGAAAVLAWTGQMGIGSGFGAFQELLRHHPAAPLLFLLAHVLVSLLFLPRTAMAMLAGLVFGVWWGGVLAAAGRVLGACTGFLIARHLGPGTIDIDGMARWGEVLRRIENGGWRAVATLRLVPVLPHSAVNYALGLTRLRLGSYAFGSLVGQLPMTVAFVQFGAAGDHALAGKPGWILPTAIGLFLLLLSAALPKLWEKCGSGCV